MELFSQIWDCRIVISPDLVTQYSRMISTTAKLILVQFLYPIPADIRSQFAEQRQLRAPVV